MLSTEQFLTSKFESHSVSLHSETEKIAIERNCRVHASTKVFSSLLGTAPIVRRVC
jgi:hypothetical protein